MAKEKKKSGCLGLLVKAFLVFLVIGVIVSIITTSIEKQSDTGTGESASGSVDSLAATAAPPRPFDITTVSREDMPRRVTLNKSTDFQVQGGQGSLVAQAGAIVDVVGLNGNNLRVTFAGGEKEIPYSDTNIEDEVKVMLANKAQREQARKDAAARQEKAKADAEQAKKDALRAEQDAIQAKIEADAGKEPGSAEARTYVKMYLRSRLNDAKSVEYLEWSSVNYTKLKDGKYAWCIDVKYRAKNAFGAYVLSQATAVIRNGRIVEFRQ